jgi:CheY-like chemotaxis protein
MPICDGYESTIQIREFVSQHNLQQPVIVACTGNIEQAQLEKAFDSFFDEVVSKPANKDIIKEIIKETIVFE